MKIYVAFIDFVLQKSFLTTQSVGTTLIFAKHASKEQLFKSSSININIKAQLKPFNHLKFKRHSEHWKLHVQGRMAGV